MNKVVIFTDSTSDLSEVNRKKYGIEQFSLYVTFDQDTYKDGIEMTSAKLFNEVEKRKKLPKSSCPTFEDIYTAFKKYIDEGYDIFYTGIGAGFSGTYSIVLQVVEELGKDRIYALDSKNLSSGVGYLAIKASLLRDEGKSAKEIYDALLIEREKLRCQFVIDSLEYLHKGGRCSGMTRVVGTILKIKPNIKVVDGSMVVARKFRGIKQGVIGQIEDVKADFESGKIDKSLIFVTHCFAEEQAQVIINALLEIGFKRENIIEEYAGCVISTHCGRGTIGTIYKLK